MIQGQLADSLAALALLIQHHDSLARATLAAGATKWDSAVLIALISTVGTIMTTALTLLIRSRVNQTHVETLKQSSTLAEQAVKLDKVETQVNGHSSAQQTEIAALHAEIMQLRTKDIDAALGEIRTLRSELAALRRTP